MDQLLKQQLHQRVKWCLMVVLALCVSLPTSAQGTLKERLSFECTNESLASAFRKLEQASGYKILFTYEDVQSYRATVSVKDSPVSDIMDALIAGHPLTYRLEGSYITVVPARQTGRGVRRSCCRTWRYRAPLSGSGDRGLFLRWRLTNSALAQFCRISSCNFSSTCRLNGEYEAESGTGNVGSADGTALA